MNQSVPRRNGPREKVGHQAICSAASSHEVFAASSKWSYSTVNGSKQSIAGVCLRCEWITIIESVDKQWSNPERGRQINRRMCKPPCTVEAARTGELQPEPSWHRYQILEVVAERYLPRVCRHSQHPGWSNPTDSMPHQDEGTR